VCPPFLWDLIWQKISQEDNTPLSLFTHNIVL
jgi:hypothetical protein